LYLVRLSVACCAELADNLVWVPWCWILPESSAGSPVERILFIFLWSVDIVTSPHSKRWWEKGSIRKVWRPGRVLEIWTWDSLLWGNHSLLPLVCYESSVKVDGLQ
jgi:hypothetical protein